MKIIPHPAVLKEKEAQLEEIQNNLAERARELHILEMVLKSQLSHEKRQSDKRKLINFYFFTAGFLSGILCIFLIS